MSYRLFLDDERLPPNDGKSWVICRNVEEARLTVIIKGYPLFVSFDNDLGEGLEEGREFAHWLIERDLDHGEMPSGFDYYVHSQNPVARDAINGLMTSYMSHKT